MSLSLSNVQQIEFDALVKLEYRSRGFLLRDTVRMRTNVTGATCQFRKVGQAIANPAGYQNTIPIQDPGFTGETATLIKYAVGTAADTIQELTVNFDSKMELARIGAQAIGRRSDQILINAIVPGGAANPAGPIPAAGSNMTYSKLRKVISIFIKLGVPANERYLAMSGVNLESLAADDHFTSRLYTSNDFLVNGNLDKAEVLGCNVRLIPDMTEGGLPLNGTIRTCIAWHKDSTGMAIGQDMRTEINYLPREMSYFVNSSFFGGATVIDNRGTIQILCDESVNP